MNIFIYLSLFLDICLALYNNISFVSWYSLGPQGHLFGLGRGELLRCPRQDAKDFPSLLTYLVKLDKHNHSGIVFKFHIYLKEPPAMLIYLRFILEMIIISIFNTKN